MKIKVTVWTASADCEGGTQGASFATEREGQDWILHHLDDDATREALDAFEEAGEGDFFDFLDEHKRDPNLDTFNLDCEEVEFDVDPVPLAPGAPHIAALLGAAESYADDLRTGLEDGTYEDRADLDAVEAAIAALAGGLPAPRVVIVVEGGGVQAALSGQPVDVVVIDYDVGDAEDVFDIPQDDGNKTVEALAFAVVVETDQARVDELFAIHNHGSRPATMDDDTAPPSGGYLVDRGWTPPIPPGPLTDIPAAIDNPDYPLGLPKGLPEGGEAVLALFTEGTLTAEETETDLTMLGMNQADIGGALRWTGVLAECDAGLHSWIDALHSWIDAVGKLPASTKCARCGDVYGEPE